MLNGQIIITIDIITFGIFVTLIKIYSKNFFLSLCKENSKISKDNVTFSLGYQIQANKERHFHQAKYIKDLLKTFGVEELKLNEHTNNLDKDERKCGNPKLVFIF